MEAIEFKAGVESGVLILVFVEDNRRQTNFKVATEHGSTVLILVFVEDNRRRYRI